VLIWQPQCSELQTVLSIAAALWHIITVHIIIIIITEIHTKHRQYSRLESTLNIHTPCSINVQPTCSSKCERIPENETSMPFTTYGSIRNFSPLKQKNSRNRMTTKCTKQCRSASVSNQHTSVFCACQITHISVDYDQLWPRLYNNRITTLCPGLTGWAGIRRNTHPPTILIITQSLSASSISMIHSILPVQIMCLAIFLHNPSPCPLWSTSWSGALHLIFHIFLHPISVFFSQHMPIPSQPVLL